MKRVYYLLFITVCNLSAQKDSIALSEVSVTATRSERVISRIPLPFQLIQHQVIRSYAQVRLQEVLSEFAGLAVVPQINGLGSGIQVQGLNPDYTLILLDGEPLIGRYTGSLELSRVSAFNIRKIEIVKGPSSSLYGSEALAGVINVITDQTLTDKLMAGVRISSRATSDLNLLGAVNRKKVRVQASINRFATDGYDLSPSVYGQTVSPFRNYTASAKIIYTPHPQHEIGLSLRKFKELQTNQYQVLTSGDSIRVSGDGTVQDWNVIPTYQWTVNARLRLQCRSYWSGYRTQTNLIHRETGEAFYHDDFTQHFVRNELLSTYKIKENFRLIAGTGLIHESVTSSRYGDHSNHQSTTYGFAQLEFEPIRSLQMIAGIRLDDNSNYNMQWSPKLAVLYPVTRWLQLKCSSGTGFKAPDFRQLYLNFNNDAASYAVYGTEVIQSKIRQLMENQQINVLYVDPDAIGKVSAESSLAFNAGTTIAVSPGINVDVNYFRNDIKGLIETQLVATTINQRNIYTYTNIHRAYTTGVELNSSFKISDNVTMQAGYQFLIAKDKDVVDRIRRGEVYGRDPYTLESYRITERDYTGLSNRSRHQASLKFGYAIPKWKADIQLRIHYKDRFGLFSTSGNVSGVVVPQSDLNGNGILDRYDRFVKSYYLVNLTIGKKFFEHFECRLGAENVFNYIDPLNIPNLPGRNLFVQLNYNLIKS